VTKSQQSPEEFPYTIEELFRPIDEIRKNAPPLEPLWGNFFFRKAITSIVGDPGIGKTTLGYGLGFALCRGEAFLDIEAEEPIKILALDYESADSLIKSRANQITESSVENFYVFNITELLLPHIIGRAIKFAHDKGINLILVDNQSMAFNTRDENDNAEAIKQMRLIRSFAVASNASVAVFHHSSKADLPGTRKGTGAFARARLADICLNIETPDSNCPDIIKFELVKNRLVDDRVLWYIKKAEGKFTFTEPPLGAVGRPTDNTIIYQVMQALLHFLDNGHPHKRQDIISNLGTKFSERNIQLGLDRLKLLGRIHSPQYGYVEVGKFTKFT